MGKVARAVFLFVLFAGVLLGIIIANMGWPAFLASAQSILLQIEQVFRSASG